MAKAAKRAKKAASRKRRADAPPDSATIFDRPAPPFSTAVNKRKLDGGKFVWTA
jgi:hypothetical protein